MELFSVIIQVGSFKLRNGKRVFKMAPIHHHFELWTGRRSTSPSASGSSAGLCVMTGIGLFYGGFEAHW